MAHILVIDDDRAVLMMLGQVLIREGHQVSMADCAKTAMKMFESNCPDLIISDILMPDQDGLELIMALRKRSADVKIIALTGGGIGGIDVYLDAARNFGAVAGLTKPVEREKLIEAVNEALGIEVNGST